MAEAIGVAASILQIAGAGLKLSTTLINYASAARHSDQDVADIAHDVQLTANALDNVGRVFEREEGQSVVSRKAVQDAQGLIRRCDAVFGEMQELIDKRMKIGKDGKILSTLGKLSWPMKEQRVELLRRRLDSLKNSLVLLLHVLQLANGQAKGEMERSTLEQERKRIRELHHRQQESLKAVQALERRLTEMSPNTITDESEVSEGDGTETDDEGDHVTIDELAKCAKHVQKLLRRITTLQQTFEAVNAKHGRGYSKNRVRKLYRRFCRKFESNIVFPTSTATTPSEPATLTEPPSSVTYTTGSKTHCISQYQTVDQVQVGPSKLYTKQSWSTLPTYPLEAPTSAISRLNETEEQTVMDPQQAPLTLHPPQKSPTSDASRISVEKGHALIGRLQANPDYPDASQPRNTNLRRENKNIELPTRSDDQLELSASHVDANDGGPIGSGMDPEVVSPHTATVQYTRTGRISKAKKGLKVHACAQCGKSFTRAEHLRRHQKNHGQSQVQCDVCGRVFFRIDLLQRHRERHKEADRSSYLSEIAVTESGQQVDLARNSLLLKPFTLPSLHTILDPSKPSLDSCQRDSYAPIVQARGVPATPQPAIPIPPASPPQLRQFSKPGVSPDLSKLPSGVELAFQGPRRESLVWLNSENSQETPRLAESSQSSRGSGINMGADSPERPNSTVESISNQGRSGGPLHLGHFLDGKQTAEKPRESMQTSDLAITQSKAVGTIDSPGEQGGGKCSTAVKSLLQSVPQIPMYPTPHLGHLPSNPPRKPIGGAPQVRNGLRGSVKSPTAFYHHHNMSAPVTPHAHLRGDPKEAQTQARLACRVSPAQAGGEYPSTPRRHMSDVSSITYTTNTSPQALRHGGEGKGSFTMARSDRTDPKVVMSACPSPSKQHHSSGETLLQSVRITSVEDLNKEVPNDNFSGQLASTSGGTSCRKRKILPYAEEICMISRQGDHEEEAGTRFADAGRRFRKKNMVRKSDIGLAGGDGILISKRAFPDSEGPDVAAREVSLNSRELKNAQAPSSPPGQPPAERGGSGDVGDGKDIVDILLEQWTVPVY